jgi:hypothetical protein
LILPLRYSEDGSREGAEAQSYFGSRGMRRVGTLIHFHPSGSIILCELCAFAGDSISNFGETAISIASVFVLSSYGPVVRLHAFVLPDGSDSPRIFTDLP